MTVDSAASCEFNKDFSLDHSMMRHGTESAVAGLALFGPCSMEW